MLDRTHPELLMYWTNLCHMLQIILAAGIRQSVKKADTEHPLVSLSFSRRQWLLMPSSAVMYCAVCLKLMACHVFLSDGSPLSAMPAASFSFVYLACFSRYT